MEVKTKKCSDNGDSGKVFVWNPSLRFGHGENRKEENLSWVYRLQNIFNEICLY